MFLRRIFTVLFQRDQSRDVTPSLRVSVILQCTSFRVHVSSFRLLLLRLRSNRCAEALAVKMKFSVESPLLRLMRLKTPKIILIT